MILCSQPYLSFPSPTQEKSVSHFESLYVKEVLSFILIIARGAGRADFIQPSLGPLQPNFDDFMELDLGECE